MRSREDILNGLASSLFSGDSSRSIAHNQRLILEVLLDIRDLLAEQKQQVAP